jgi:hypothetical protein
VLNIANNVPDSIALIPLFQRGKYFSSEENSLFPYMEAAGKHYYATFFVALTH